MKNKARAIQICGTGSGVGKSILVAAFCRIFTQDGFRVSPFKAQNMALNSAVTPDGLEIGRAQALQAAACGIEPCAEMNPVLLKPTSHEGSQVIVKGKPIGNMSAKEYYSYKRKIFPVVRQSLFRLINNNDVVVIEGAGSPAEINLKKHDIVNMRIARLVNCPVLLAGDIDRGGVFAWLLGTINLLPKQEQRLIAGFIINKFRGDKRLLEPGLRYLERKSKKKVYGVVPYIDNLHLPQEDSLYFDQLPGSKQKTNGKINISVIKLPHISNFTDFDALAKETDVNIDYVSDASGLNNADGILIPGTKNTLEDISFLFKTGLAQIIRKKAAQGIEVAGICGGFQILGNEICDIDGIESRLVYQKGLCLLDAKTHYEKQKTTVQVKGHTLKNRIQVCGYEIHHGKTTLSGYSEPFACITRRGREKVRIYDGAVNEQGNVWGTYIHGIFDSDAFRRYFLDRICMKKNVTCSTTRENYSLDVELNKLAQIIRSNVNIQEIKHLMRLPVSGKQETIS